MTNTGNRIYIVFSLLTNKLIFFEIIVYYLDGQNTKMQLYLHIMRVFKLIKNIIKSFTYLQKFEKKKNVMFK